MCVQQHSRFPPIRVSMRSRLRWRSLCTMKSSRERMRKDEMQLTISLIPLAIESNRLFPSEETKGQNKNISCCKARRLKWSADFMLCCLTWKENSAFFFIVWRLHNLKAYLSKISRKPHNDHTSNMLKSLSHSNKISSGWKKVTCSKSDTIHSWGAPPCGNH